MLPFRNILLAVFSLGALIHLLRSRSQSRTNQKKMTSFTPDTYIEGLRNGNPKKVFGLNVNLVGPPPASLLDHYLAFIADLKKALEGIDAYFYPDYSVHITAASSVPFTTNHITDPEERELLKTAWIKTFKDFVVKQPEWPREPFEITYMKPVLDPGAAYFDVQDPTGAVDRLRTCIKRAHKEYLPNLPGITPDLLQRAQFKVPFIIHTTFLRFGPRIGESKLSVDEIRKRFDATTAKSWKPLTIRVSGVLFVNETMPYMHLHLSETGKDRSNVLMSIPFA